MKKLNAFLNILMGSFFGFFVGNTLSNYREFRTHPEIYEANSAPWYCFGALQSLLLFLAAMSLLSACAGSGAMAETSNTETIITETTTTATEARNTIPEERNWDRIPTVMIDGVLYESTGYISSAIGCGNMDGKITSSVEGNEEPAKNDQSNFGVGYEYQRSSEGQIVVVMDGMKVIFRDPKHSFTVDIPEEVLNFNAEVLEVRNGSLLVSFISTPDIFTPPFTGQCVVRVNPQILKEEVKAGDTVRVWFDGLVQEIYPPILPNVYRVVKEEQEPAEPEPSETKAGTQREDGFTLTAAFDVS